MSGSTHDKPMPAITEEMVELALDAARRSLAPQHILDVRQPWHASDRNAVRAMLNVLLDVGRFDRALAAAREHSSAVDARIEAAKNSAAVELRELTNSIDWNNACEWAGDISGMRRRLTWLLELAERNAAELDDLRTPPSSERDAIIEECAKLADKHSALAYSDIMALRGHTSASNARHEAGRQRQLCADMLYRQAEVEEMPTMKATLEYAADLVSKATLVTDVPPDRGTDG